MSYLTENFNKYAELAKKSLGYYIKSTCHSMKDLGGVNFESIANFQVPAKGKNVPTEKFRHSGAVIMAHMVEENGSDIKFWRRDKMHYHAAYLVDDEDIVKFVLYIPTRKADSKDTNVQVFEMGSVDASMTRIEFNLDDLLA